MFSVLYIDDDPAILDLGKITLEMSGNLRIDTAASVGEALGKVNRQKYDGIISDYEMPGVNGIDFLRHIRLHHRDLPFILFTRKGGEEIAIDAINSDADFYLRKSGDQTTRFVELEQKILTAIDRKRIRDNIRESRQQMEDLVDSLPYATFAINHENKVISWNRMMETMTGVPPEAIIGTGKYRDTLLVLDEKRTPLVDLVLNNDKTSENAYPNLVRNEDRLVSEIYSPTVYGGKGAFLSLMASPIYDSGGRVTGAIGSIRDITPQKIAESALRESEARFQRAETIAHLGHWQLDLVSGIMTSSEGAGAIYGMKDLTISTAQKIPLPEYRQVLDGALQSLITEGKPYDLEYKIRRANDWAPRDIHSVAAYDAEHRIVFGVIQDITDRKQFELKLQATNEQLSATQDELRDRWQKIEEITAGVPGIVYQYYVRPNGEKGAYYINERAGEIILGFDYSDKDFFRWFTLHVHPDDRNRFLESIDDSQKKVVPWFFEGRFVKPSGETIWFCGRGNPAAHRDELVCTGVFLDITEKKTTEITLRESEEKFLSLAEHSPESILIIDVQGTILFANNAAVQIIGAHDRAALADRNLMEFIAQESREDAARDFTQLSMGHDACPVPLSVISAQGKKIQMERIGKALVYEGKTANLLSVRSITDRERLEDAPQEGGEQILLHFNNLDAGWALHEIILNADKTASDYRVLAVNDSFEQQLGISRTAVIGKTSREAYNTKEPLYLDIFAQVADSGEPETFETCSSTFQKHFRISVYSPRKNQFATVFYDITDRKQAEEALRQANIQLNLLTSITRHDILNKVSTLIGYLGILRMKFPNPALTDYISKLEDTAVAIQCLITDTQTCQNLGLRAPQWQDPDKLIRHLHFPETVALTLDLQGAEIYADPMLEKVFFNLLDNSIRHGRQVTGIRVSSRRSNEGLVVVWEDNGAGIPIEEKDKIFEKGYGKNTGLGLFLCREILAITGMTMRETGEPGKGARFEIMIPKGAYRPS